MSPDFRSHSPATVHGLSRRRLLVDSALGFGALAMNALLGGTAHAAASANPGTSGPWSTPHHRPRAKNVIFLYMDGGVSQVDTFDPKPRLTREDGKPFGLRMEPTQFEDNGATLGSPWAFRFRGQSGLPVSELFPQVGSCADDLCVIRSMVSRFSEHNAANYFLHSGSGMAGRPSMGAWATYGLGTENRDLPGYVVLDGGSFPRAVWTALGRDSFLPVIRLPVAQRPARAGKHPTFGDGARPSTRQTHLGPRARCRRAHATGLPRRTRSGHRQRRTGLSDANVGAGRDLDYG